MDDIIRGTSVVCMALVGIVFTVLLRNLDMGHLLPWVNTVTHYIMPVVVVLDWLYQPPLSKLAVKQISYWLIFPLLYLAYSVSRGAIVGFYAYPFLNPDKVGGYGGVVFYSVSIIAVFLFVRSLSEMLRSTADQITTCRNSGFVQPFIGPERPHVSHEFMPRAGSIPSLDVSLAR